MKSNDNNSLFEVFKPGVRDDLSFWPKLWYWFTNVYWYHFKKITILGLFGVILLIVLICDIINKPNDDTGVIIAGDNYVSLEQERGIVGYIESVIDDANGDGEISVAYQTLCTSAADSDLEDGDRKSAEQYDEFVQANQNKLLISFADDQFLLYIMDKVHMEKYIESGALEPLETFGVSSENPYYLPVGESSLFAQLGIENPAGNEWCAGIKVIADSRADNKKIEAKYEQAVKALKMLAEIK